MLTRQKLMLGCGLLHEVWRNGALPAIRSWALLAIVATDESLEEDNAAFRRADHGHRANLWFRSPLNLHSVESARAGYNTWAASQWEHATTTDRPPTRSARTAKSMLGAGGNPYAAEV